MTEHKIRATAIMKRHATLMLLFSAFSFWLAADGVVSAQADPFGGDLFGLDSAAPAAAEASGIGATDDPAEAPIVETDPTILTILQSDPQTPRELVRAADLLIRLNRPAPAKGYIARLLAADLEEPVLAELQRQFGSALFLHWMRESRLAPEGGELADRVLGAAYAAARDPRRIADRISRLGAPTQAAKRAAILDLNQAGDAAVLALIRALGDPIQADGAAGIREALIQIRPAPVEPLVAALQSDNDSLRGHAVQILEGLARRSSVSYLLVPALVESTPPALQQFSRQALVAILGQLPSHAQAADFLERQVDAKLAYRGDTDGETSVPVWSWSNDEQTVVRAEVTAGQADLLSARLLAEQLHRLDESNTSYRRTYDALRLEADQRTLGLDALLQHSSGSMGERLAARGPAVMLDLLAYSLRQGHTAAAVAVINLMGERGTVDLLAGRSGQPTGLAAALRHPSRRLRFAATRAISKLQPSEPYPGCSYFPESLAYFAGTVGTPRGLVIHQQTDHAQSLVAMLGDLGIDCDSSQSSRGGYKLARNDADYEIMLISDAVDQPPVGELIQQMRHDPLTSHLPIGVMAQPARLKQLEQLFEADPLTIAFPVPYSSQPVSLFAARLQALAGDRHIPYPVRVQQANLALAELQRLASDSQRYPFYDLMRYQDAITQVLFNSQLAAKAAPILGHLGSPTAQRALITAASQNGRELLVRQAAAAAFATAVERRGLLLTRREILLQYDLYNQSAQLDKATQLVLGSLLDAIERPTVGSRASNTASRADS